MAKATGRFDIFIHKVIPILPIITQCYHNCHARNVLTIGCHKIMNKQQRFPEDKS